MVDLWCGPKQSTFIWPQLQWSDYDHNGITCSMMKSMLYGNRQFYRYWLQQWNVGNPQAYWWISNSRQFNFTKLIDWNRRQNHTFFVHTKLYVSQVGAQYDLSTNRFVDSYFFGVYNSSIEVNQTALVGEFLYAATEEGLYKADTSDPTLVLESAWDKIADGQWKSIGLVNNIFLGVVQSGSEVICYVLTDNVAAEYHRESGTLLGVEVSDTELVLSFSNTILAIDDSLSVRPLASSSGSLIGWQKKRLKKLPKI